MKTILFAAVVASLCTGCSTFFHATAPGPTAGSRYVVGSKADFPTPTAHVWLCQDAAGKSVECEDVVVVEK